MSKRQGRRPGANRISWVCCLCGHHVTVRSAICTECGRPKAWADNKRYRRPNPKAEAAPKDEAAE